MKVHVGGGAFLVGAVLAAVAVLAVGFFAVLGVPSGVAGPGSAPPAAPPNPGHSYSQIELPAGTWSGLNADLLDGLHAGEIRVGRLGFSTTTVDSAGVVGGDSSVTIGTDGLPVISYEDNSNANLKVAHCGNAACSAGNTVTTVDSAGRGGSYTSVTIGADGLPFISYWLFFDRDLKVAHCGNAACTAGNTITTVDSTGEIGDFSSATVGVDGLPLISYYDWTNGDLKVAHCSNRFCVPYHRPR